MKRAACLLNIVQLLQRLILGNILSIVLREGAQVALTRNVFSGTECVASWYILYYFDETVESPPHVAYGAHCTTAAVDAEGGD